LFFDLFSRSGIPERDFLFLKFTMELGIIGARRRWYFRGRVMSEELLPLFPLQTVLFPNSALPLHIFEERYKSLIQRSISDNAEFGINLVEGSSVSSVGCAAVVRDLLHRYDDGKMDIIVEGRRRYRVQRYDARMAEYLMGTVQFLENTAEPPDRMLLAETLRMYNALMAIVYKGDPTYLVGVDRQETDLSFVLSQKSGMDVSMRQQLLELDSENARLRLVSRYLEAVLPKVERVEEIERIIQNDGYL
jgi:Lon protease-like protein